MKRIALISAGLCIFAILIAITTYVYPQIFNWEKLLPQLLFLGVVIPPFAHIIHTDKWAGLSPAFLNLGILYIFITHFFLGDEKFLSPLIHIGFALVFYVVAIVVFIVRGMLETTAADRVAEEDSVYTEMRLKAKPD